MSVKTKASVASFFESGDKPTSAEFGHWIDSSVFIPGNGATGVIEVESTASSTSRAVGAFGALMLSSDTTASAQSHIAIEGLESGTFGKAIVSAETTASAQSLIGQPAFGAFGVAIASAATTASAQTLLGGGTVGIQVYEAATTAAVQSITGGGITTVSEVSAAGANVDFTGIPAGTQRITIGFRNVSLSGNTEFLVVLGDSVGFETTGYASTSHEFDGATPGATSSTAGFVINGNAAASFSGSMTLRLADTSGNVWIGSHAGKRSTAITCVGGGDKTLSGELTQVRIEDSGASTFDSGSLSIQYE